MTNLIYCYLLCLGVATSLPAQVSASPAPKRKQAAVVIVPPAVEQKFTVENPEARANWKVEGELFKALFINPVNNLGHITVYDKSGNIVRKERELEKQDYPPAINDYHEKRFPGEGFAVWITTDSAGHQRYYSMKNESTHWFDRDGNPMNKENPGFKDSILSNPSR